ncbi:hypothetical protein DRH27_04850, partial [Candidatus Falkowbacteria bacterium]
MAKIQKTKELFKRFKPESIRACLTMPKNWLHIAGLAIFLLSVYFLIFNPLPKTNNNIELSHTESGAPASITITNKEFKIELRDIYSDIDEAVFSDQARANQYIEAISYKPKKKNINTVNNKKVALSNINTNIVYMDDSNIEFNKANIDLKKEDNNKQINTILYCDDNDFNKKTGDCANWQISGIKPKNKDDHISFSTYHFSAYVGAYLEIIDVQSNLTKGDVWEVRFQTEGQDSLEIEAVDGTLFDVDIEFINISCGENQIANENIIWEGQKLTIENYSCDNEISRIRNQAITGGRHWLSFSFGYTQGALAHNFACDSGDLDTDCYVDTQQYLGDGDEISGTGNLIVQSGGDLTASSSATSGNTYGNSFGIDMGGDITIQDGGMITGNMTATATDIDVQSGGTIDVGEKGYNDSEGIGAGNNGHYAGGASYGGQGGAGNNATAGLIYGSTTAPTDLGSGGGDDTTGGGKGGGAVKLNIIGTTTIEGIISANGGNGSGSWWPAGGSGGSVYIITSGLEGMGTINAIGGNAEITGSGSGGGGRIAVYYTSASSSITYQAYGGLFTGGTQYIGGAGTIYKKSSSQSHGDLIIDNNDQDNEDDTYYGKTVLDDQTHTFNTLTIQNDGHLNISSTTNISYSALNWADAGNITDNGGVMSPFSNDSELIIATTSRLHEKVIRTFTDLTINGTIILYNYSTSSVGKLDVSGDVLIGSSGKLTHQNNTTAQTHVVNLEAANLIIQSGGTIDVDYKGLQHETGDGKGATGGASGGAGYGGEGGDGTGAVGGGVYGSTTMPTDLGSGGGNAVNGGSGGGVIILSVIGTTTVAGTISANGQNAGGWDGGGGSGGSVLINTDVLTGIGTILVNGGGVCCADGAGGGGRIAIYYTTDSSSISYQAYGGTDAQSTEENWGGAGTIYKKSSSQSHGDLIIDNNDQDEEDGIYIGKTVLTDTLPLNTLTIQNYGHLYASSTSNITYSTINWSDEAIIEDYGGLITMFANTPDITIASTS